MRKEQVNIADFHAHILPKADHGSGSIETSLAQLEFAKAFGVTRILATPHFYPHRHTLENFLLRRKNAIDDLLKNKTVDLPEIKIGAEVLLCSGLERFKNLDDLCFKGTKYLLLELPFIDFKEEYCETAYNLLESGFDIILAHADRYPMEHIERMIDAGVSKLQINTRSLVKVFPDKHLFGWIKKGYVVSIGSDIHGADKKSYKVFSKSKKILSDYVEQIKLLSDKIWDEIESENEFG